MNYLENLQVALTEWNKVPPERVRLDDWVQKCGTIFCFGGWLVSWPHFYNLGVRNNGCGAPYIPAELNTYGVEDGDVDGMRGVSEHLFGDENLFCTRAEESAVSDWQIVHDRLTKAIAQLQPVV